MKLPNKVHKFIVRKEFSIKGLRDVFHKGEMYQVTGETDDSVTLTNVTTKKIVSITKMQLANLIEDKNVIPTKYFL